MQATHDLKTHSVVIHLSGTMVEGQNPAHGEGTIGLTSYGAKMLAYELLSAAESADHYEKHS